MCSFLKDILEKITGKTNSNNDSNQKNVVTSDPYTQEQTPKILILVINSLKQDIIQSLKKYEIIESGNCENLYLATQCLWLGSQDNLSQNFRYYEQFKVKSQEESEYDVYLVQIELENDDNGFKPDADQLKRISAFRKLTGLSVKVSDRLRVEVYENTGVYSC